MRDLFRATRPVLEAIERHSGYPAPLHGRRRARLLRLPPGARGRRCGSPRSRGLGSSPPLRPCARAARSRRHRGPRGDPHRRGRGRRRWAPARGQAHTSSARRRTWLRGCRASPRGTVIVSGDTRRAREGLFELEDLGAQALKGVSPCPSPPTGRPSTAAATRLDARVDRLTPLVGRGHECGSCSTPGREVAGGAAASRCSAGSRGSASRALPTSCASVIGRGPPRGPAALLALPPQQRAVPLLRPSSGRPARRRAEQRGPRLDAELSDAGSRAEERRALIAELLAIPYPGRGDVRGRESAQRRKRRTLDALQALARARATAAPARGRRGRPLDRPEHARAAQPVLRPGGRSRVCCSSSPTATSSPAVAAPRFVRRLALGHLPADEVREVLGRADRRSSAAGGCRGARSRCAPTGCRCMSRSSPARCSSRVPCRSSAAGSSPRDAAGAARALDAARVADGAAGPARRCARGGPGPRGPGPRRRGRFPRRHLRLDRDELESGSTSCSTPTSCAG